MTDYKDPASVRAAITRGVLGAVPPNRSNLPIVLAAVVFLGLVFVWVVLGSRTRQQEEKAAAEAAQASAALPQIRPEQLAPIKPLLEDVKDGEAFVESDNYLEAIRLLNKLDPAEFRAGEVELMNREAVLAHPESFRGTRVRVMGLIATVSAVKLDHGDRAGVSDVWRGILTATDATDGIVFEMPTPPGEFEVRRDVVQLDGIFYRTVRYDKQNGKSEIVPYLLVRSAERAPPEKLKKSLSLPDETMPLIIIGLAGAWILYRITSLRRPSAGPQSIFARRQRMVMRPIAPNPEQKS